MTICWNGQSGSFGWLRATLFAVPCQICEVVHTSTQLWSKQNCQRRILLEEKEEYLLSIWLWTYGHVIVWAVTSDWTHAGTSLHGYYGGKCYYHYILEIITKFGATQIKFIADTGTCILIRPISAGNGITLNPTPISLSIVNSEKIKGCTDKQFGNWDSQFKLIIHLDVCDYWYH